MSILTFVFSKLIYEHPINNKFILMVPPHLYLGKGDIFQLSAIPEAYILNFSFWRKMLSRAFSRFSYDAWKPADSIFQVKCSLPSLRHLQQRQRVLFLFRQGFSVKNLDDFRGNEITYVICMHSYIFLFLDL